MKESRKLLVDQDIIPKMTTDEKINYCLDLIGGSVAALANITSRIIDLEKRITKIEMEKKK